MTALTIAGFDPSSGAGVTADLQVFAAHGIFGTSIITALTAQSTLGVTRVEPVPADFLYESLKVLTSDLAPDGVKIGMLGGVTQVREVVRFLRGFQHVPAVLDPVIRSSSGADLLEGTALHLLRDELLPLVTVVTPNVAELAMLTGTACTSLPQIRNAAEGLGSAAGCNVIVTGGDSHPPVDLVLEDGNWTDLPGEFIDTPSTHGTGCAFSSAVLCGLMQRQSLTVAAGNAKAYVAQAMRSATPRGGGRGPMNLLWPVAGQKNG